LLRIVLVPYADFYFSAKEAVAAMIKRLAHRNANVQLYTLEVRDLYLCYWGAYPGASSVLLTLAVARQLVGAELWA
jgi:hypothetical protein